MFCCRKRLGTSEEVMQNDNKINATTCLRPIYTHKYRHTGGSVNCAEMCDSGLHAKIVESFGPQSSLSKITICYEIKLKENILTTLLNKEKSYFIRIDGSTWPVQFVIHPTINEFATISNGQQKPSSHRHRHSSGIPHTFSNQTNIVQSVHRTPYFIIAILALPFHSSDSCSIRFHF